MYGDMEVERARRGGASEAPGLSYSGGKTAWTFSFGGKIAATVVVLFLDVLLRFRTPRDG